jgi:hypothetical protein
MLRNEGTFGVPRTDGTSKPNRDHAPGDVPKNRDD